MRILITLACILLTASCASTGRQETNTGYVKVLSSGAIIVNGRQVSVDNVGPALKSRGFGARSQVNIHVSDSVSPRIMKMVTISLARSGFKRVMFIRPKEASSDIVSGNPENR